MRIPWTLVLACVVLFFAGMVLPRLLDHPGVFAGSFLFNALIALPAVMALWRQVGARRAVVALFALSLFAYLIEGFGTVTGYPYGDFFYGEVLGPKVFGLVPYLLPLSYVPLVIGTVGFFAGLGRPVGRVVLSALLLVLVDGVLDPGAVELGFWVWPGQGLYYGVPLSNFLGWLLSGLVASALLTLVGGDRLSRRNVRPGLLDSLIASLSLWLGVSTSAALVLPAILAAVLLVALGYRRRQLRRSTPVVAPAHGTR